jgi:hypothetical protein
VVGWNAQSFARAATTLGSVHEVAVERSVDDEVEVDGAGAGGGTGAVGSALDESTVATRGDAGSPHAKGARAKARTATSADVRCMVAKVSRLQCFHSS